MFALAQALTVLLMILASCAPADSDFEHDQFTDEHNHEASDFVEEMFAPPDNCQKATPKQINQLDRGNEKAAEFLKQCWAANNGSGWCHQVIRPRPRSLATFRCTYGPTQPFQLIPPDESTWVNAIRGVRIVRELERLGIDVNMIYYWWRPEPFNRNVGGVPQRHPYATSIDVDFPTVEDQDAAFYELCKMRRQGRIRAVGYYGTFKIHIGVGDHRPNTWGRRCD